MNDKRTKKGFFYFVMAFAFVALVDFGRSIVGFVGGNTVSNFVVYSVFLMVPLTQSGPT